MKRKCDGAKSRRTGKRRTKSKAVVKKAGLSAPVETLMPKARTFSTTLRYGDTVSLDAAAGSWQAFVVVANGLYDPQYSIGGHQPRGFDQIMTMYDLYQVKSATIYVEFINSSAAGSQEPCLVGICAARETSLGPGGWFDFLESPNQVIRAMPPNSSQSIRMSLNIDIAKFLGYDNKDGSLKGNSSSNPAQSCYFHIFQASTNGVLQNPGGVYAIYTIVFNSTFEAEKTPPIS